MAFLRFDAWSVVLNDYSAALDALRCDVWGTEVVRPVVAAGDGDAVEEQPVDPEDDGRLLLTVDLEDKYMRELVLRAASRRSASWRVHVCADEAEVSPAA